MPGTTGPDEFIKMDVDSGDGLIHNELVRFAMNSWEARDMATMNSPGRRRIHYR